MATSAAESPKERPKETSGKKKGGRKLLFAAAALLLVAANLGFWLYRVKPHLPLPGLHAAAAPSSGPPTAQNVATVTVDPFIVNLAGGSGYLKVAMTLCVRKASPSEEKSGNAPDTIAGSALVRDTILEALSSRDADSLLTTEGKTALKKQLMADLTQKAPGLDLQEIYFTDFLVER